MIVHYRQLYIFTSLKLNRARRLATLGEKDQARDEARFLRNSCIVEILKPHSGELLIDAHRLDFELRELERECHPLSPALSDADKFSQILSRLDLIAACLSARAGAPSGQRTKSPRCNSDVSRLSSENDSGLSSSRNPTPTPKASVKISVLSEPSSVADTESVSVPDSGRNVSSVTQQELARHGGGSSRLRLASKDSRREFPALESPNGRVNDRAATSTLRLRVDRDKPQANKEKV